MSLDGLAGYVHTLVTELLRGLGGADARHDAAMIPKC